MNAPTFVMHTMPYCILHTCCVTDLPSDLKASLRTQLSQFIQAIDGGTLRGRFCVTQNSLQRIARS